MSQNSVFDYIWDIPSDLSGCPIFSGQYLIGYRCTYTTNNHCRGYQGRILRKFRIIHRACSNLLPNYHVISSLPLIFGILAFFLHVLAAREKFRGKGYWSSTFADEL
ncbi:MAG: hypothetical protein WCE93_08805, partial [Nitrososphaeraceae archaeon]